MNPSPTEGGAEWPCWMRVDETGDPGEYPLICYGEAPMALDLYHSMRNYRWIPAVLSARTIEEEKE